MRRGHDTANEIWGNETSVLVGDFLYSRAFQMMAQMGSLGIMSIMADATNTIAEGEVLQLLNAHDPQTTEQRYFNVIYRKTAKLFEAGAEIAAVLAGASDADRRALAEYGRHVGTAFQLVDDLLDYRGSAEERGKNLGEDLAEGKPTLPLIHALKNGNIEQRAAIRLAIEQGGLAELATSRKRSKQRAASSTRHAWRAPRLMPRSAPSSRSRNHSTHARCARSLPSRSSEATDNHHRAAVPGAQVGQVQRPGILSDTAASRPGLPLVFRLSWPFVGRAP